jgi:hypothetical protein
MSCCHAAVHRVYGPDPPTSSPPEPDQPNRRRRSDTTNTTRRRISRPNPRVRELVAGNRIPASPARPFRGFFIGMGSPQDPFYIVREEIQGSVIPSPFSPTSATQQLLQNSSRVHVSLHRSLLNEHVSVRACKPCLLAAHLVDLCCCLFVP